MLGLYLHAVLASSRHNPKKKGRLIRKQKIDGRGSHIVYIGHVPHARSVFSQTNSRILSNSGGDPTGDTDGSSTDSVLHLARI